MALPGSGGTRLSGRAAAPSLGARRGGMGERAHTVMGGAGWIPCGASCRLVELGLHADSARQREPGIHHRGTETQRYTEQTTISCCLRVPLCLCASVVNEILM